MSGIGYSRISSLSGPSNVAPGAVEAIRSPVISGSLFRIKILHCVQDDRTFEVPSLDFVFMGELIERAGAVELFDQGSISELLRPSHPAYPYTAEPWSNQVRRCLALRVFTTAVLEQIAARDPKAKGANPETFYGPALRQAIGGKRLYQ